MNTYDRAIRPAVEAALFKGKVVVIYGARQVGRSSFIYYHCLWPSF